MRVISGTAGGITLKIPKTDLRPTMDMVRSAIFSSIAESVNGARVLDLFAGSGSLAIEALSRGAAEATLVESDRKACAVIAENLSRTRLKANVVCMDVFRYLQGLSASRELAGETKSGIDLILADPPYSKQKGDRDFALELLGSEQLRKALAPEGLLILEVAQHWKFPEDRGWECLRRRRYGSTETLFLQPTS